jgi:hypothetical protein
VGTPLTLSATATSGLAVSFTSTTTGICTISGTTATFIASGTCTIDANQAGNSTYAAATMVPQSFQVNSAPIVSVSPSGPILSAGGTQQFLANVTNTSNTAVTWSIIPAGRGTISSSGLYTAPAIILAQQTVTITATSQADTSQSASTTATLLVGPCPSNGYNYQRAIVIDHTKVPNTDQSNFPFLFNTTDPLLANTANGGHVTNPNGYDIIFTSDVAGNNVLPFEQESYVPSTGTAIYWVNVPTVSHTQDTVIYVWYGNANVTTSQANASSVWSSNYAGVYHFPNGTTLSANDSTANDDTGVIVGAIATTGEIGGGVSFGNPGYISLPNLPDYSEADFTVSTWINFSSLPAYNVIMVGESQAPNVLFISTQSNGQGLRMGKTATEEDASASFTWSTNTWYHFALTRASGIFTFYVNGTPLSTNNENSSAATFDYPNVNNDIGGDGGNFPLYGSLDEFRILSASRSADWIATEYNNQSSPSTFSTVSNENVFVTPSSAFVYPSQSQQFTATLLNSCPGAVVWSESPSGVGTLSASGLYTAPAAITSQQTVTITATSQDDSTKSGSATVTLLPVSQLSGPAGTVVTIAGTGFGNAEGSSSVTVGGLPAVALMWSNTQIQIQIPTGTGLGNQNVIVTVGGQISANITFTVTAGLVGISPSLNGTLASVTINTPGQYGQLIFNGTPGQSASVLLSNYGFSGGWSTAGITILNPDGSTLVSNSVCPYLNEGCVPFQNAESLPATGIYTLEIVPESGETGSVSFTLWEFSNLSGTITSGVPVPVTINDGGQEELLTFNGTAGEEATVNLSNFTFSNGGWSTLNVSILNPDGSTLLSTSVCPYLNEGCNLFVNAVTLPTTGTYTLVIAPPNGETGGVLVTLELFNNLVSPIVPGNPTPVTINTQGQDEQLTFFGAVGQTAAVQLINPVYVGSDWVTVNVSLLNPDGTTLFNNSVCVYVERGCDLSMGPITLPQTGVYTLVVAPQGGATGSVTVLVTLSTPKAVTVNASLAPVESYFGSAVSVNLALTASSGAIPTGTVSCSGAGVTSSVVTVNAIGGATVPMSGLPLGKDAIVCSFISNNINTFFNAVSPTVIESVIAQPLTGSVTITPASVTLNDGQVQQFIASVYNTTNQSVNWAIRPSGAGTISATGFYSAPTNVTTPVTVTVTATSQADPTQSGSAMISLTPSQCASSGYAYQRSIVIDHTKVQNTDQSDFPFLFNTTDPSFAISANGGHVTSASGYDIIFSLDPGGVTKLDHELEQYNPLTGQVVAWVRIPTLSHTADTVLYVFYGNSSVTTSQQNPGGVWDSNFTGVYHLANAGAGTAADSSANGNTATLASVTAATGEIDGAGSFNGTSSYMQVPSGDFLNYPISGSSNPDFSASFGVWFKTATAGVILGQTDGTAPGGSPGGAQPALYVDAAGLLRASLFSHGSVSNQIATATAYNDNNWHFAADTYTNGTEVLYVDGQFAGSQQVDEDGYNSAYAYFVGTGETANWPAANGGWLYFNGTLDEVNVSSTARSADWIQTQYSNQSSPATFYTLYPENAELVIPGSVNLYDGQSQQFTVMGSVPGTCSSPSVVWSMPSGMPGTLTASGIYTAPNSISSQLTVLITATTLGTSSHSISGAVTLMPAVAVSLTPDSLTLTGGQTQQFTANVANTSNTAVTWTTYPAGAGTISASGLYTAPTTVAVLQTVALTATSQVDPAQSASATITLTPTQTTPIPPSPTQCGSTGYNYERTIVIDHTKVPNTDQTNFPFLFNTTDPSLATIANGGRVTSSSGYDIFFSTDPNGASKLDHELEEYDPVHGQVIAWVRIPNLSHTTDAVLYLFYGNPNIIAPQQNPSGVWDSDYTAVYHLANVAAGGATDSTLNGNNAIATSSVVAASGEIDGAGGFNGASSSIQIPESDFPNYPIGEYSDVGQPTSGVSSTFSTSFGLWFKTASAGGILMQSASQTCTFSVFGNCVFTGPMQAGDTPDGSWDSFMYVDDNGKLNAGGLVSPNSYNDNIWHFAVWTLAKSGGEILYVDGQNIASGQGGVGGYAPDYAYFVGAADTFQFSEGNWNWLYFNGSIDEVKVSDIPRSSDWIQTEYNNQSSPATFYSFNPANTAQVVPSSINLYASQSQQFAATVACDTPVNWSMPNGAPGVLTSAGLYTAPSSISTPQTAVITATNQTSGSTIGSGVVTLLPAPQPITLAASVQPPYTTGNSQAFSATLLDQDGTPQIGISVTFAVSGANSIIGSAVTASNGVASFSYTGANTGIDTIIATAVANGHALTSNNISAAWVAPVPVTPVASVKLIGPPAIGLTGLVGAFTDANGAVVEPLAIGASAGDFVVPAGASQLQLGVDSEYFSTNGGPGFEVAINGVPVAVPATALPWTWALGGLNNSYQYGIYNPGIQSGILDGSNPVIAASNLTQGELVSIAYQSGTASSSYPLVPSANANGNQTLITGTQVLQGTYFPTLYTTPSSYPLGQPINFNALVTSASGTPLPNVPVTLTVTGANPQQLQATTDSTGTAVFLYAGLNAGTDTLEAQASPSGSSALTSSQSSVTWINYGTPPAAGTLQLQLLAYEGDVKGYDVLATDASGNPVFDANIGLYVWGADNFIQTGKTDVTGHVEFTYGHVNAGAYNIVAVESTNRNVVFSNVVPGTFTGPIASNGGNAITVSISSNNPVVMPNSLQINGTVTDSAGLTPTIAWSLLSGPGMATFANPNQATTSVTFSDVGDYVLQLSASDAAGASGSVKWPITVVPPVTNSQGWIGNPIYGSTVTGLVPITLAPGVSLASGVLSYYPASNNSNVTVLNADTTGSGQIGKMDTTMLAN